MSEYFFGLGRGRIKDRAAKHIDRIAGRHGATLVRYREPGSGHRYWFAAPNRGEPFDSATARAVFADLRAARWADEGGIVAEAIS